MEWNLDNLLPLYESMVKIRMFEDAVAERYKIGEVPGFVHLYHGEEAVAVGVCASLGADDVVTSTHRGHGHAIAKGMPLNEAVAELFGKSGGCSGGRGGSMHMYDNQIGFLGTNGMVGGGIGLATGAAFYLKYHQKKNVAVSFFGDGASNMGIFYESMNLASVHKLPVIYVCENNLYATCTPLKSIAANPDIASRAAAFNMPGISVDGNDVQAVYEIFAEYADRARNGEGPAVIEAKTYRQHGHNEGDPLYGTYRTKEEVDTWIAMKEPIHNFEKKLREVYGATEADLHRSYTKTEREIAEAIEFARESPLPDPATVELNLFREAQ
ncbi:MAG: thiamine pyrophosphate-dependent dehydrogenase E1 component subunit alpha [Clostridiaceae bacterium]|nr:thiamine pyrophosphate-dependent dehydrogenase E1 component subunit alpha [Clostridiaceae bacterium]